MVKTKKKSEIKKVDLSRKKSKEFDIDTNIKVAYKTGKIVFRLSGHLSKPAFIFFPSGLSSMPVLKYILPKW